VRERERALALVGRCGLKVGMGRGVGWVCFPFFFKTISNQLQTLFKSVFHTNFSNNF
jgi:hypothetical protein